MKLNDKWLKDPDTVLVMQALQKKGNKALFVGGCVRNSLLKMPAAFRRTMPRRHN